MKDTLWMKFPDESVAGLVFDDAARARFEAVFDAANPQSPWSRAVAAAKFRKVQGPLVKWHEGMPYFNWNAMMSVISGGAVVITKTPQGEPAYGIIRGFRALWNLFVCQWRSVKLMKKDFGGEALVESIALGLVMQSLMLRLGAGASQNLAKWLAGTETPPKSCVRIVMELQQVQMRRTALSPVWKNLLPAETGAEKNLPEYFWNDAPAPVNAAATAHKGPWKGLPVCAGQAAGRAVFIKSAKDAVLPAGGAPLVLVFRRARPDAVELYPRAAAVVFAEGGVLSHACVVAREMNIPCVTGLGADFFDAPRDGAILSVDGGAGTVEEIRN